MDFWEGSLRELIQPGHVSLAFSVAQSEYVMMGASSSHLRAGDGFEVGIQNGREWLRMVEQRESHRIPDYMVTAVSLE